MRILVALGGNAILKHRDSGTSQEQLTRLADTANQLIKLVLDGHHISMTHGNGPQVGDILLLYELGKKTLPSMPLDVCGAESQGQIGYMFQQSMSNALKRAGLNIPIVTVLTQTLVDANDDALKNPTKPIGPYYNASQAEALRKEKGWTMVNDNGRGFRRIVPSPNPVSVVESRIIKELFDMGVITIHSGGGGIPVVCEKDGSVHGVEAVIDKDLTASLMAIALQVDLFLILTDVERVFLNYGKPNEVPLDKLTTSECEKHMAEGQFPSGSMGPKIEAAKRFVLGSAKGRKAIITSLDRALDALSGKTGTLVTDARQDP